MALGIIIRKKYLNSRAIQKNFVDMENMFDLMGVDSDVKDAPGAPDLLARRGGIEFKHVSFGYGPERLVLKNVSFKVPPGTTVALVSDIILLAIGGSSHRCDFPM